MPETEIQSPCVSEEEARGKGTILEPFGGPRFILIALFDVIYLIMACAAVFGYANFENFERLPDLFQYLVFGGNAIYFGSRTYEKYLK